MGYTWRCIVTQVKINASCVDVKWCFSHVEAWEQFGLTLLTLTADLRSGRRQTSLGGQLRCRQTGRQRVCSTRRQHLHLYIYTHNRVQYKLGVTVRRCQQHKAPQYLTDCVMPASDIASRQRFYALPVVTNFLCRVTNSAHLVVGPSLSLDQRLGICCRLTSVIRRVVTSLSDVHWKHFCLLSSQRIRGFSVTTIRYINQHYLSIYCLSYIWHTA